MSRTRTATTVIEVQATELARLTAHVEKALDRAQDDGARTPAVLRDLVMRPLIKKLAKLNMPRQRQIEIVLQSFASFDAAWAKALVASPDTIGRLLDALQTGSKRRVLSPRRSRSGGLAPKSPKHKATSPPLIQESPAPSSPPNSTSETALPSIDNGMAHHTNLWGESE